MKKALITIAVLTVITLLFFFLEKNTKTDKENSEGYQSQEQIMEQNKTDSSTQHTDGIAVDIIYQIQTRFPEEYKEAQKLRQTNPAAYREKMRELQRKLRERDSWYLHVSKSVF